MSEENSGASAPASTAPVEGVEAESQDNESSEAPVVTPKNLKKYKFKVDGVEQEEEIDLNDDESIRRHLSMSKVAYKRMQDAAGHKKQNEQLMRMLKEDPMSVLTNEQFGGAKKFRELAESYLAREIEEQMLSPEEKTARDREQKLRKYEETEKQAAEKEQAEQEAKLVDHYTKEFETKLMQGLSVQGVPKTVKTAKRMAELMSKNLQYGLDLAPEQLAQIIKEDYIKDMQEMFGASEGDVLLKLLGDPVANKIRKADLARLKGGNQFQGTKQGKPVAEPTEAAPKRYRPHEYEEMLKNRIKK